MDKRLLIIAALACAVPAMAQHELKSVTQESTQQVELRQEASVSYDLPHGFDISLSEDLREVLYDHTVPASGEETDGGAYFYKSYTTVELGYKPLDIQSMNTGYKYGLRLTAGYTLRLLAQKDLTDASKCLQHRPHATLVGSVNFGNVKLSLRERYLVDIRLDSVSVQDRWNPDIIVYEKNPYKMELRSRLRLDYQIPGKPLKPYAYVEVTNTLNEQDCPWTDSDGKPYYSGQYLNSVRASVGLKWKIDKHNSLSMYYLFGYLRDRDINITRGQQHVELTYGTTMRHSIGISYDLGY